MKGFFGGALDAHYDQVDAWHERQHEAHLLHAQEIDDAADEIEENDMRIEEAISDAMLQSGSDSRKRWARDWDERYRREVGNLFRARSNSNTDEILEAAQGLAELIDEAVRDLAKRQVDKQSQEAA